MGLEVTTDKEKETDWLGKIGPGNGSKKQGQGIPGSDEVVKGLGQPGQGDWACEPVKQWELGLAG